MRHHLSMVGIGRRRLLVPALLAVLALTLAACHSPGSQSSGGTSGTIKIGFISPVTGTTAASGIEMLNGWKLYWKLNPNTVAGRKIQWTSEDDAGDLNTGLQKARKLVEQNGDKVLVGPLLANVSYAIAQYLSTQPNVVGLNPVASADDLSQRKAVKNYVRTGGWQSSTPPQVAGDWAYQQGYRKAITLCNDYAFGQESCGGFINTFTDHGGKIVKSLWSPLGTTDYSSYLAQINPKDADVVFITTVGADSVRVIKGWSQFGLKGKIPLIGQETTLEQSLIRAMGDAAVGLQSFGHYAEGRDDPMTQSFDTAYEQEYHLIPSYYACAAYTAGQWFSQALTQTGGDLSNVGKFTDVLRSIKLTDSCLGPVQLDSHGGTVFNVYLRQVAKDSQGRDYNKVLKTFPNTSQFYWYKPDAFLAQPVYSRQYLGQNWPTSCDAYVTGKCPSQSQ